MGIQAVTFIISSFVTGIYLDKIGRSRGMVLGCLLVIVSIVGLGLLDFVDSKLWFVLLSFVWKFLCGVGAGINSTSSFAIISTHFKAERERYIGYMENASGLGLLLGPTVGSILYKLGGYMTPFFTMASVYFLMYPLIVVSL
jgi:MFS family permease